MALMDSLMFWRKPKEENLNADELDKELAELEKMPSSAPAHEELGQPGLTQFGQPQLNPQQPSFTEIPTQPSFPQQPVQQQSDMRKDIELLSTKLDALRSSIEVINQRLQTIEGLIRGEVEEKKKTWRYG